MKENEQRALNREAPVAMVTIRSENAEIWQLGQEEISWRYSTYLLARLDKLLLPHPDFKNEDNVGAGILINKEYLSESAMAQARDAIRKERKERTEITRLWLGTFGPIVSALTGLVGALIGLLAALHH
jgi:hypothetical protein